MSHELVREIKRLALEELGFDLIGIAPAVRGPGADRLRRWLDRGRHASMSFMARSAAVRSDPQVLLPQARSVVAIAMACHDPWEPPELKPSHDRVVVARYARRRDYHKVIKRRLVRLGRWLADRVPGLRWRVGVDSAPLLEKELAERAGLGWIGKNTCVINRALGSELLLGELLVSAELPVDASAGMHCGRCRACLDACPTGALVAPFELDARRCISYLTIEHRSALPAAAHQQLSGHLFGCDICQAVCPWNRRAPARVARPLATRLELASLTPAQLAGFGAADWAALVAGSPLRRLSFERMRRNLAAASGSPL